LARALEGAAILLAVVMTTYLIRARSRGKDISFDVTFVLVLALSFWTDPLDNFLQPIWLYNSNFLNVGTWAGHIPFVRNPAAGKVPEPILFGVLVYAFGILAFAMLMGRIADAVSARRPGMSRGQLWLRLIGVALLLDLALETPLLLTGMERMAGFPSAFSIGGHSPSRFALMELIAVPVAFSGLAMLRLARNDRGETLIQRGSGSGKRGRVVSFLALTGLVNLAWIAVNASLVLAGLYADHYPRTPAYLLNGVCGTGTEYGQCPGTPGYTIKLK
jgi:hypothetical protein